MGTTQDSFETCSSSGLPLFLHADFFHVPEEVIKTVNLPDEPSGPDVRPAPGSEEYIKIAPFLYSHRDLLIFVL